jgi:hypothetical protein
MNILRSPCLLMLLLCACSGASESPQTPASDTPPVDHSSHEPGPLELSWFETLLEAPSHAWSARFEQVGSEATRST